MQWIRTCFTRRLARKAGTAAVGFALALLAFPAVTAFASSGTAEYSSIPSVVPGNVPSEAFEAQSAREFGDEVSLAPGGGTLQSVSVVMSSWGCESGHWDHGDCSTTPGATF